MGIETTRIETPSTWPRELKLTSDERPVLEPVKSCRYLMPMLKFEISVVPYPDNWWTWDSESLLIKHLWNKGMERQFGIILNKWHNYWLPTDCGLVFHVVHLKNKAFGKAQVHPWNLYVNKIDRRLARIWWEHKEASNVTTLASARERQL